MFQIDFFINLCFYIPANRGGIMTNDEDEKRCQKDSIYQYAMTIDRATADRISKIRSVRKLLEKEDVSVSGWMQEAIEEKLKRDSEKNDPDGEFKMRTIKVDLSQEIKELLDKKIEELKTKNYTFSTRRWIMSAIFEKLIEEEISNQKELQSRFSSN